jgi:hypothetical protein
MFGSGSVDCSTMVMMNAPAQPAASSGSQLGLPRSGFCSSEMNATTIIDEPITSDCVTEKEEEQRQHGRC